MENILCAGYGRQDITPDFSVPLAGYGVTHKRMSTNVLSNLFATCIAFSWGEEKLLLFTEDLIRCTPAWATAVRSSVSEKTGIPENRIMICATHTHSAPDPFSDLDCIKKDYLPIYVRAMTAAAEEALADLAPASLYGTSTQTEKMNFVRHYLLENGTYAGPNFGDFRSAPIVDHAAPNDPQLLIMKLERQEKPSILLVNFQVHPTATGGNAKTDVSADFVGVTRDNLEASTGMHFAYFTGAAGNQVLGTRIPAECDGQTSAQNRSFGGTHYMIYGWRLAQDVLKALPELKKMNTGPICLETVQFEHPVNHDDAQLYDEAVKVRQILSETDRTTANLYAKAHGISSIYHAAAIVSRRTRPETSTMELNAVRIGDMTFVTMPYEAFAAHGVYVKEHSPFPMTMIFSCANGGYNYIPTREAYEYGCYESFTSIFAKGTGEDAAEKLVQMLNSLQ